MKCVRGLLPILAALVAWLVLPFGAWAAPPEVSLTIAPATVQLASGETTRVWVIARNASTSTLQIVSLTWLADAAVTIDVETTPGSTVGPNASQTWTARVTRAKDSAGTGQAAFRLDYVWTDSTNRSVPGSTTASLEIQERPTEAVDKVVEFRIETGLGALEEPRQGNVYLVVSNLASVPLTVTRISASAPDFIQITPQAFSSSVTLSPQTSRAFTATVLAGSSVQVGKHAILFEVFVEWNRSGRSWSGSVIRSHTVELGVLGESDIVKLVGAPSFLLLPGFLVVATYLLLHNRILPRKPIQLDVKTPDFWILAVSLSILAIALYGLFTGRNVLARYGLSDILNMWTGAIVVGLVIWAIALTYRRQVAHTQIPSESDLPIDVLRKLANNKLGFYLPQVDVLAGQQTRRYLASMPVQDTPDEIWALPLITFSWTPQATEDFKRRFIDQLDRDHEAKMMVEQIKTGQVNGMLTVRWETGDGPVRIKTGAIRKDLAPRRLIKLP